MKFKKGDKVRQIHSGYGTDYQDNGKEAIVIDVGLYYVRENEGIKIAPIGKWVYIQEIRGEKGFELALPVTQTERLRRIGII